MFETFTTRARKAIVEAQSASTERGDAYIGTEHLLVGLLREGTGLAAVVLKERSVASDGVAAKLDELIGPKPATVPPDQALATIGIDLSRVRDRLENTFGPGALIDPSVRPPFTPRAKEALERAVLESERLRHRYVGTEHELLAIVADRDGRAAKILSDLGVDLDALSDDLRARAAPAEQQLRRVLAERRVLDRSAVEVPDDKRDEALEILGQLGEQIQAALHQEYEASLAATRRLTEEVEAALDGARRRLDQLRS